MSTHTPGPWHVDKSLHRLVYDANGVGVGEAWHGVNEREYEEEEANARLMAAAPNLLAALKGLTVLDTISEGPQEGAVVIGPQGWANARDAIALAEEEK